MRQAADILASPAAMQIRQLEALQTMAKTSQSKVIFVPMQLQGDVNHPLAAAQAGPSGSQPAIGSSLDRTAIMASLSDV